MIRHRSAGPAPTGEGETKRRRSRRGKENLSLGVSYIFFLYLLPNNTVRLLGWRMSGGEGNEGNVKDPRTGMTTQSRGESPLDNFTGLLAHRAGPDIKHGEGGKGHPTGERKVPDKLLTIASVTHLSSAGRRGQALGGMGGLARLSGQAS